MTNTKHMPHTQHSILTKHMPHAQHTHNTLRLEDALAAEAQKRANWRDENIRRKHNYIPFIFNMLRMLAEKNKLQSLIDKARREK